MEVKDCNGFQARSDTWPSTDAPAQGTSTSPSHLSHMDWRLVSQQPCQLPPDRTDTHCAGRPVRPLGGVLKLSLRPVGPAASLVLPVLPCMAVRGSANSAASTCLTTSCCICCCCWSCCAEVDSAGLDGRGGAQPVLIRWLCTSAVILSMRSRKDGTGKATVEWEATGQEAKGTRFCC